MKEILKVRLFLQIFHMKVESSLFVFYRICKFYIYSNNDKMIYSLAEIIDPNDYLCSLADTRKV